MQFNPYLPLAVAGWPVLAEAAWQGLQGSTHGDLQDWIEAIKTLPEGSSNAELDRAAPVLGQVSEDPQALRKSLLKLHPWRKGPLVLGGLRIDTEWRSDWKWNRIAPHLELAGQQILDIGCGNGYFGLRMLGAGARLVVGIDPTMVFVMQWLAMQKLAPGLNNYVLPMGIEQLPADTGGFDTVFSMGVLYHRREPIKHLRRLRSLVHPGGCIVLETLVLQSRNEEILKPENRYARMRNVHAVPTVPVLQAWLKQAGLPKAEVMDVSKTTPDEQRSTQWMRFESLRESLDKDNQTLTVEGHPAPMRAALLVKM